MFVFFFLRSPGHIGFGIRVESTAETTAKTFQPTNTCGCDVNTMSVEVLRRGQEFQQPSHVGYLHKKRTRASKGQFVAEQS